MLDDLYIGLTPVNSGDFKTDWKQFKSNLVDKNQEQQIDSVINHIDPNKSMSEETFTKVAKPYFDKLENYNVKNNVKQAINDIVKSNGKVLFYDWILDGLTEKANDKLTNIKMKNNPNVRARYFVPEIDAEEDILNNAPSIYPNEFDRYNEITDNNYSDTVRRTINRLSSNYDEDIHGVHGAALAHIRTGDEINSRLNEQLDTTGSDIVDRIADVASPRYRIELRRNELLRDLTEYEASLAHNFYTSMNRINNNPIHRENVSVLSTLSNPNNRPREASFYMNDNRYPNEQHNYDRYRADLFDSLNNVGEFTDEQKKDILNAARNNYINITSEDIFEARGKLAYNVAQHVLDVLAIQPQLRIAFKTALSLIKNIPDKSKTGWEKVYNIFLDSGIIPFVAFKKLNILQYVPANIAGEVLRYLDKIKTYTGVSALSKLLRKITSIFPQWSGLNLNPTNEGIQGGVETMFRSDKIASKIQLNNLKSITRAIKRHLKNSGDELQMKINVKRQNNSKGMMNLVKNIRDKEEAESNKGMLGLIKRTRDNENKGMLGLIKKARNGLK